ncbi:MAG: 23S rRNA (uracil-5-)-methyltransferase RumA, partial [Clostridiales bacterium]|nr:23S rRNA (uracil-5-)-methyltransferase RumA [Clostridiales bacterium]
TNCDFLAGDAFEVIARENFSPNTIIADPPRDGLAPKALAKIASLSASRIVYVACKPKSLARDIPALIEAGYTLSKIEAVDMFPRTPHVECVCLLSKPIDRWAEQ